MKVSALPADQQLNLTDRVLISDEGGTKTATIQQVMEAITSGAGGDVNLSLGAEPEAISAKLTRSFSSNSKYYYDIVNVSGYAFGNLFYYGYKAKSFSSTLEPSSAPAESIPTLSDLNPSWTKAYILYGDSGYYGKNGKYEQAVLNSGNAKIPYGSMYTESTYGNPMFASFAAIGIAF